MAGYVSILNRLIAEGRSPTSKEEVLAIWEKENKTWTSDDKVSGSFVDKSPPNLSEMGSQISFNGAQPPRSDR